MNLVSVQRLFGDSRDSSHNSLFEKMGGTTCTAFPFTSCNSALNDVLNSLIGDKVICIKLMFVFVSCIPKLPSGSPVQRVHPFVELGRLVRPLQYPDLGLLGL